MNHYVDALGQIFLLVAVDYRFHQAGKINFVSVVINSVDSNTLGILNVIRPIAINHDLYFFLNNNKMEKKTEQDHLVLPDRNSGQRNASYPNRNMRNWCRSLSNSGVIGCPFLQRRREQFQGPDDDGGSSEDDVAYLRPDT